MNDADLTEPDGRLVLVRHGETEWSRTGRHTGLTDIPLTETGAYKAELAGTLLATRRFDLVLTSPLQRAVETAARAGYPDAPLEPRLVEWDYGAYEGLTTPEIIEQLGHPWTIWQAGAPAGATPGESIEQVTARAASLLDDLRPRLQRGEQILVFSHAHFLRALAGVWLGLTAAGGRYFVLGTSAVSELGFEHGNAVITQWNHVRGR
ncbi:histidine phosphatase family protein [Microbacterium testaceum]|uniref:histidine phosphatase family protein n=1 Tax=Microbacterium testaceum TaxID=2033 RepID=UPI000734325A|nr:histidine phosphatase family protein [Microbacterium testaceum]KTS04884.1 phosphoglycerate mutase [Microbacterium testaceum]